MSELTKAGDTLATIAFNLAQKCGHILTSDECQILDEWRKKYDASKADILRLDSKAEVLTRRVIFYMDMCAEYSDKIDTLESQKRGAHVTDDKINELYSKFVDYHYSDDSDYRLLDIFNEWLKKVER